MVTPNRPTPALLGVEIYERSINDIMTAKETLKQMQAHAQRDVTAMKKALKAKQVRLEEMEQTLCKNEEKFAADQAAIRKTCAKMASSIEKEFADLEGLGAWETKQTETIKRMQEELDAFEEQAHTLRELHEKCERLNQESKTYQKLYDDNKKTVLDITARFEQLLEERDALRLEIDMHRG